MDTKQLLKKSRSKPVHQVYTKISRLGWQAAVSAILLGVAGNIVFAIIGLLPEHRDEISAFLVKTPLFWVIIYITLIGIFGVLFIYNKRRWTGTQVARQLLLNSLDSSLLLLLPALIATDKQVPLEVRMERLIAASIIKASEIFPDPVRRGLLFRPDEKKEQLIIHYKIGWTADETDDMKFQRMPNGGYTGVAGEAYEKGKIIIAHKDKKTSDWDQKSYIHFKEQESYKSIACIPIIGTPHPPIRGKTASQLQNIPNDDCLGILCLDSGAVDTFDSAEAEEILEKLARHLAVCLQIYSKLSQACSTSSCIYRKSKPVI